MTKTSYYAKVLAALVTLAALTALTMAVAAGPAEAAKKAKAAVFKLGQVNAVTAISALTGKLDSPILRIDNDGAGANATALDLQVEPGKAPMTVNSDTRVANLNADKLDGKSAGEIGVNGIQRVTSLSAYNSDSPKSVIAFCPAGKVVVGTGYDIGGSKRGTFPNQQTDVVIDQVGPSSTSVTVEAYEEEPTSASWDVSAYAICAFAP